MLIKVVVILLAIVVIAFGGIFYNDYLGQTARADTISSEIQNDKNTGTIAAKNMQKVNDEIREIAGKSAAVQQEIKLEEGVLPEKINSNQVLKDIITRGKACSVSIIPLSTDEWTKTQVNKINYQVLKINVEVKGRHSDVLTFISHMQESSYPTMVIDRVNIHRPKDPSDTDIIAVINLAIYAK